MEKTKGIPSPEQFRLWTAISIIAGAMERKAWTPGAVAPIYPNLFVLLVSPPASGKTNSIMHARNLWVKIPEHKVSPNNVTKPSLIDVLSRSLQTQIYQGQPLAYSSLSVPVSEFGVFFPTYDMEFLSVLNDIYDNPPIYREERRTSGVVEVIRPSLNILAGTQPDFLGSFMPETAWGMGFTSRIIMIYASSAPVVDDIFASSDLDFSELEVSIKDIATRMGEFKWTDEAKAIVNGWNKSGCHPVPDHHRLTHYIGRRCLHLIKLSMVAAMSNGQGLLVDASDVNRAKGWLLQAEKTMPDIFRAMGQKSDINVLKELHFHLYRIWSSAVRDKRQAIPEKVLWEFLSTRITSDRIDKLIETAEKMGIIRHRTAHARRTRLQRDDQFYFHPACAC